MVSLGEFIIYAYFFSDYYRLSAVFGVSIGMYIRLCFSAIASIAGFSVAIIASVRTRKKIANKLLVTSIIIATLAGGIAALSVAIASYFYITYPSFFTFIPETTLILNRVSFVSIPIIGLFFWIFFSQLIGIRRAVIYGAVVISSVILFLNSIATITAEEVQLMLYVNMGLIFSFVTLSYWLVTFIIISISFFYYASKQKGERRIMGAILGTAGIAAVMILVSQALAFLFSNAILSESVWIFAAAAFTLMHLGSLPLRSLLTKEPKRTKRK
ncbi:MAG: hypothetical protein WED07_03540 [Candidatus Freyarchaeum deiterrae]